MEPIRVELRKKAKEGVASQTAMLIETHYDNSRDQWWGLVVDEMGNFWRVSPPDIKCIDPNLAFNLKPPSDVYYNPNPYADTADKPSKLFKPLEDQSAKAVRDAAKRQRAKDLVNALNALEQEMGVANVDRGQIEST